TEVFSRRAVLQRGFCPPLANAWRLCAGAPDRGHPVAKNETRSKSRALVARDPTKALVFYTSAKRALAKAASIDEVKPIREKARAMEVYAAQARDREMQCRAWEIRM